MQEVISVAANPQLDDLESVCLVSEGDIQETAVTVIKTEYMDITKQELDVAVGHGSMSFLFLPMLHVEVTLIRSSSTYKHVIWLSVAKWLNIYFLTERQTERCIMW